MNQRPLSSPLTATGWTNAGLFLITLSTLMFEILLTRIFSVTMWYHFAFVAISIAMFGMTVGALIVYLFPNYFALERVKRHLALFSLWFALLVPAAFLVHLRIPFILYGDKVAGVHWVALTYLVISLPFVFSGVAVALALTKFPGQIGRLYAFDLAGAALGCVLLIYTLEITDGPTAVIVVGALAALGSVFFAVEASSPRWKAATLIAACVLTAAAAWHTVLTHQQKPILRLSHVKGRHDPPPLYEKWNSFSRVDVIPDPEPDKPFGWGLSPVCPPMQVRELQMRIDAEAGTVLTGYSGDPKEAEHLKYDVTNLAHYLRSDSDVLIVGSGGGRDVLSALVFDQKSVRAVEINQNIVKALIGPFGEFTGHLDRDPRVTFVVDEARSYLTRISDAFDILQVSLIDTWAATAAGAFVLSESTLYTVEAWEIFLNRLSERGILTFSRWYFRDRPGEMYRLVSLASASLQRVGIENPRGHILAARRMHRDHFGDAPGAGNDSDAPEGVGTILVARAPFSERDIALFESVCERLQFDIVLTPRAAIDDTFAVLASGTDLESFARNFPINIAPPTDDSPFFFHMLRARDIFDKAARYQGMMTFNMKAVSILGILLLTVFGLSFLCVLVPLILTTKRETLRGALPLFLFFAGIGLGFMLVEISQMQRLIVFLGHPTYGLSVVLFAILLSSSAGSAFTQRLRAGGGGWSAAACLAGLLLTLILFGMATPSITRAFQGGMTPLRITVAVGILFPLGFFMGMAFPLGMRLAARHSPALTPWLWGINGAMSVCASVLAIAIALCFSISVTFWSGFACYVLAAAAFVWAARKE